MCKAITWTSQFSQALASNSLLFGVLAVEFSVESKNINHFAGERDDFFSKNQKGGPLRLKIFNEVPPFEFLKKCHHAPQQNG